LTDLRGHYCLKHVMKIDWNSQHCMYHDFDSGLCFIAEYVPSFPLNTSLKLNHIYWRMSCRQCIRQGVFSNLEHTLQKQLCILIAHLLFSETYCIFWLNIPHIEIETEVDVNDVHISCRNFLYG
jgi:hypothetical protein